MPALATGSAQVPNVQQLEVGIANVFVISGARPILIDTGTPSELDDVKKKLHELHIDPEKLALIVATHCHADHAGGAKQLRDAYKVPIAIGARDVPACADGHNRGMNSMSMMAGILKPFIPKTFPAFEPDVAVVDRLDLRPYGVAGEIIAMPGHTPGSVVVVLDDGDAFLGDLFAGGRLGGGIRPSRPQHHYYHTDEQAAEANVCKVISLGAKRLYLGHGGPVSAEAASARFCSEKK